MPDAELSVLIYSRTDDVVEQGYWSGDDWLWASGGDAGEVTHWMHLPLPPRKKNG